jgi:hypothetical protein
MDDPRDVILYLIPHKGEGFDGAVYATAMSANDSRVVRARRFNSPRPRQAPYREERAGTEPPIEHGLLENTDSIVVRFSAGARSSIGVVCGCSEAADLVLQHIPGVSRFHLAFTFDDHNRLIARDLGSTCGTKVTYGEEERAHLQGFDWPLVGPAATRGKTPILNITDDIQFKVVVPAHDITSPDYAQRVEKFRRGRADPEDIFADLLIKSVLSTRHPTGYHTPSPAHSCPILYRKTIGVGAFGIVDYVWNLTTREEYVVKEPLKKHITRRQVDVKRWKQEADIMKTIRHVRTSLKALDLFRKSIYANSLLP